MTIESWGVRFVREYGTCITGDTRASLSHSNILGAGMDGGIAKRKQVEELALLDRISDCERKLRNRKRSMARYRFGAAGAWTLVILCAVLSRSFETFGLLAVPAAILGAWLSLQLANFGGALRTTALEDELRTAERKYRDWQLLQ